jgi:hypothetical protein
VSLAGRVSLMYVVRYKGRERGAGLEVERWNDNYPDSGPIRAYRKQDDLSLNKRFQTSLQSLIQFSSSDENIMRI